MSAGLNLDITSLRGMFDEIEEIDQKLDAAKGGEAGKTAFKNSLVKDQQSVVDALVSQVVKAVTENYRADDRVFVGVVEGLLKGVSKQFGADVDKATDRLFEQYKAENKSNESLSDEEIEALSSKRSNLAKAYKLGREALIMFGVEEAESLPEPAIRRGRTPGSVTKWSKFQYAVNGEDLPEEANSLSFVAKRAGISTKVLKTEYMEKQGIDLDNLPAQFTVQLPMDLVLTARALPEYEKDFTEESEESEVSEASESDSDDEFDEDGEEE